MLNAMTQLALNRFDIPSAKHRNMQITPVLAVVLACSDLWSFQLQSPFISLRVKASRSWVGFVSQHLLWGAPFWTLRHHVKGLGMGDHRGVCRETTQGIQAFLRRRTRLARG